MYFFINYVKEAADQLHQALQTANDMEVLYLDTQRKFAEMQTQFHEKETEYEAQIHTQQLNFQQQLDVETGEKRRLAKELVFFFNFTLFFIDKYN